MSTPDQADRDALAVQTHDALAETWRRWGVLDDDVLTHLVNPTFAGGPRWPAMRQAFRTARAGSRLLLASDGLADPFDPADPADRNGLGLEVFAITGDPIESIPGSWLWNMVWNAAQLAARHGGVAALLDELGTLSTELNDVPIPEEYEDRFLTDAGRVGVLLGLDDEATVVRTIEGPLSPIRLVSVVLLTFEELEYCIEGRDEGRREIADKLRATGTGLVSSLTRPAVI